MYIYIYVNMYIVHVFLVTQLIDPYDDTLTVSDSVSDVSIWYTQIFISCMYAYDDDKFTMCPIDISATHTRSICSKTVTKKKKK